MSHFRIAIAVGAVTSLSGCYGTGVETTQNRAAATSAILSSADLLSGSVDPVGSGMTGTYIYNGYAFATAVGFAGNADATITANFDNETISAVMVNWVDGNPDDFYLRGELTMSDGQILAGGDVVGTVTGYLIRKERSNRATEFTYVIDGTASPNLTASFYDSVSGESSKVIAGDFATGITDQTGANSTITGTFVAAR